MGAEPRVRRGHSCDSGAGRRCRSACGDPRAVARALSELKTQPHSSVALVSQESMSDLAANFKGAVSGLRTQPTAPKAGAGAFIGSLRGSQASHGQNRLSFPTFGFVQIVEAPTRCFPERIRAREEPHPRFLPAALPPQHTPPPLPPSLPKSSCSPDTHTALVFARRGPPGASHT